MRLPRINPFWASVSATLAYNIVGDLVSGWLRDNGAVPLAEFVAWPWSSALVLVVLFVILWTVQQRATQPPVETVPSPSRPPHLTSAIESVDEEKERDTVQRQLERERDATKQFRGEMKLAKQRAQVAESKLAAMRRDYEAARNREQALQSRLEKTLHGLKVLVTWLYRRDNWHGLSTQGRISEAAPWDGYARERYASFGLVDEPYERTNNVHPEPNRQPPTDPEAMTLLETVCREGGMLWDSYRDHPVGVGQEEADRLLRDRLRQWEGSVRTALGAGSDRDRFDAPVNTSGMDHRIQVAKEQLRVRLDVLRAIARSRRVDCQSGNEKPAAPR